jgi:hypothetical protein
MFAVQMPGVRTDDARHECHCTYHDAGAEAVRQMREGVQQPEPVVVESGCAIARLRVSCAVVHQAQDH